MITDYPYPILIICSVITISNFCLFCWAAILSLLRDEGRRCAIRTSYCILCAFFNLLWGSCFTLALLSMHFPTATTQLVRSCMPVVFLLCFAGALFERDAALLVPGLSALLSIPFFEGIFSRLMYSIGLTLLLSFQVPFAVSFVKSRIGLNTGLPDENCIPQGLNALHDGVLFADRKGFPILCNTVLDTLSRTVFHHSVRNAHELWNELTDLQSSGMVTKTEHNGSYLLQFTGGDTWSFFREELTVSNRDYIQVIALNITELDRLRRRTIQQRSAADRLQEELPRIDSLWLLRDQAHQANESLQATEKRILEHLKALTDKFEDCTEPDEKLFLKLQEQLTDILSIAENR